MSSAGLGAEQSYSVGSQAHRYYYNPINSDGEVGRLFTNAAKWELPSGAPLLLAAARSWDGSYLFLAGYVNLDNVSQIIGTVVIGDGVTTEVLRAPKTALLKPRFKWMSDDVVVQTALNALGSRFAVQGDWDLVRNNVRRITPGGRYCVFRDGSVRRFPFLKSVGTLSLYQLPFPTPSGCKVGTLHGIFESDRGLLVYYAINETAGKGRAAVYCLKPDDITTGSLIAVIPIPPSFLTSLGVNARVVVTEVDPDANTIVVGTLRDPPASGEMHLYSAKRSSFVELPVAEHWVLLKFPLPNTKPQSAFHDKAK